MLFSGFAGCMMPTFGIWLSKYVFLLQTPLHPEDPNNWIEPIEIDWETAKLYSIIIACYSPLAFIAFYANRMSWCVLAENMTKKIRKDLYSTMLAKHMGWFDKKEHSPGQLTSILATEVQTLNGVSSESVAALFEAFAGLITGIVLGLIYQWQVALVAIAITPLMIIE